MGELSDDEIASLSDMDINTYEPASMATVIKLAREVKRHRAARSASAERVREVVYSVSATELAIPVAVDIANRVAALLRSAPPDASAERVRSVVESVAAGVLGPNGPRVNSWDVVAHAIADRVASQLAVPESHRVQVARLADSLGTDLGADAVAATALRARADSRKLAFPVLSAEEREAADWLLGRMTDSMLGTAGGHGMRDFQMLEDARALIRRLLGAKP